MRTVCLISASIALMHAALPAQAELSCTAIPDTRDPCLAGTWLMTDESKSVVETRFAQFMFGQVRAAGGEITDVTYAPPVAALYEDGLFTFDHPISISGNGTDGGTTFFMTMDLATNRDIGQWASDGRTLLLCPQGGEQDGTMTVELSGGVRHSMPIDNPTLDEDIQSGKARYSCAGDTLQLVTEPTEWIESLDLTFTRIGAPGDVTRD